MSENKKDNTILQKVALGLAIFVGVLLVITVFLLIRANKQINDNRKDNNTVMTTETVEPVDTEYGGMAEPLDTEFTFDPNDYDTEEVQKLLDSAVPYDVYVNMTSDTIDLENDPYASYDSLIDEATVRESLNCPEELPVSFTLLSKELMSDNSLYYQARLDNTNILLNWSVPVMEGEPAEITYLVDYANEYDSQFPCAYYEDGIPENATEIEEALSTLQGYWFSVDYVDGDSVTYTDLESGASGQIPL